MSTSSITAAMTIAASVASGSRSKRPVRKSSVSRARAAAVIEDTWDFAPAEPLTAVFESEPLTTMPEASPAPKLETPRPMSSRLASTS